MQDKKVTKPGTKAARLSFRLPIRLFHAFKNEAKKHGYSTASGYLRSIMLAQLTGAAKK